MYSINFQEKRDIKNNKKDRKLSLQHTRILLRDQAQWQCEKFAKLKKKNDNIFFSVSNVVKKNIVATIWMKIKRWVIVWNSEFSKTIILSRWKKTSSSDDQTKAKTRKDPESDRRCSNCRDQNKTKQKISNCCTWILCELHILDVQRKLRNIVRTSHAKFHAFQNWPDSIQTKKLSTLRLDFSSWN